MIKHIIVSTILVSSLSAIMTFEEVSKIEKKDGTLEALGDYKKLAKKDDVNAMFRLAQIYSKGDVIKRNISQSYKLLKKASSLNHHKSTYFLGKLYLSKKSPYYDLTDAFNTFLKAANENYAPAQNMIAQFLVNGIAVDKDYKMAVRYLERASKQNFIDAQCNLAYMYASGKGVFPNFGRAHQFAKEGYKLGNKRCKKVWKDYNLGKYPEDKGWKFKFYSKP